MYYILDSCAHKKLKTRVIRSHRKFCRPAHSCAIHRCADIQTMYILYVLVMNRVENHQICLAFEKNRETHCSTKWKTQTPEFGTLARPDHQT